MIKRLGTDLGFADNKVSYRDDDNNIVSTKISAIAAEAPMDADDLPLFEKKRYFVGDKALLRDSKTIIEMLDYESLEQYSPLSMWKIFDQLKINPDDLDTIVTGLSLAQVKNTKNFLNRLSKFTINNKKYDLSNKLKLLPQGVGAKYTIDYFYKDNGIDDYLIIDAGFLTIDVVDVNDNVVRKENLKGYEHEGIIKIARNVQEHIMINYNELVSLKEAKEIMSKGVFQVEGNLFSISDYLNEQKIQYTEYTLKVLRSRFEREFKKYPKIFFVGGGAHFIDPAYSKIIEVVKDPEYYNSIGNLLFAEKSLGLI